MSRFSEHTLPESPDWLKQLRQATDSPFLNIKVLKFNLEEKP